MTITQVDSQTKTAAFVGAGIDISGITSDWTLKINVQSITVSDGSVPLLRFEFDDTVNSFTGSLAGPTCSFKGTLSSSADQVRSWKKQDFPDLRTGTASAQLRLQLSNMSANATAIYRAWLEY
jgi:hypothetical protein